MLNKTSTMPSIETKKRIIWLDYAKFFCIMFVIISHLEANTNIFFAFYQPFFLFGFFFVSGYVYNKSTSFKNLIVKKAKTLLLPWLLFSLFNIILSQILSFNEHKSFVEELAWNFAQIRGLGDHIWFLPALFVAFIPFFLIIKFYNSNKLTSKKRILIITITTFLLSTASILYTNLANPNWYPWKSTALPWHIEYIFQAVFFMWLGLLFKDIFEKHFDKIKKIFFIPVIAIIYISLVSFNFFANPFGTNVIYTAVYHYLSSLCGVTLLVSVCKALNFNNKYMTYIGKNTLICFALHGKIYSLIQTLLNKIIPQLYKSILNNTLASIAFSIIFAILISLILIIPIYIINRWFPFVLGQKRKKS